MSDFEIDMAAQKKLFELVYQEKERYAKHLCTKPDVTKKFGVCNWDNLDSNIRELVVDLTYRGRLYIEIYEQNAKSNYHTGF
ncbi:MAG: hypothetical protein IPP29_16965 [Bacteroidetes bacterium]|nr:hypothetical protein [Bacteroidota bacterium]